MAQTQSTKSGKGSRKTAQGMGVESVTIPTGAPNVVDIPVGLIVADPEFNVRGSVDEENVKLLAGSIKREGLKHPVVVTPRTDGKYDLLVGFTRFYAYTWPKAKGGLADDVAFQKDTKGTIRATIQTEGTDRLSRLYANLVENEARNDLNPYDLAKRCAMIAQEFPDQKGPQIAARIGKHPTYVNDLLLVLRTAQPEVLDYWRKENDAAYRKEHNLGKKKALPTDKLKMIAKLPRQEQLGELDKALGRTPQVVTPGANGQTAPGTPAPDTSKTEPIVNRKQLQKARIAIRAKMAKVSRNTKEHAAYEMALNVIKWCQHPKSPDGKLKGIVNVVTSDEIAAAKDGEDPDKSN